MHDLTTFFTYYLPNKLNKTERPRGLVPFFFCPPRPSPASRSDGSGSYTTRIAFLLGHRFNRIVFGHRFYRIVFLLGAPIQVKQTLRRRSLKVLNKQANTQTSYLQRSTSKIISSSYHPTSSCPLQPTLVSVVFGVWGFSWLKKTKKS